MMNNTEIKNEVLSRAAALDERNAQRLKTASRVLSISACLALVICAALLAPRNEQLHIAETNNGADSTENYAAPPPIAEGSVKQLIFSFCLKADTEYFSYENALKDARISEMLPKNLTAYGIEVSRVAYNDGYTWIFGKLSSNQSELLIGIETIKTAERKSEIEANYQPLDSLPADRSIWKEERTSISVYIDGYSLKAYNGNFAYYVMVADASEDEMLNVIKAIK